MLNIKGVSSFLCVLIVFILLTSCSTAGTLSWLKFWDSPHAVSEIPDNDVVKFVSTIRPTRGNPNSHYLLANYYQKKGLYKDAIKEYKKIIEIDPLYLKAYNGLGVSYDQLGYYSEAVESYQKALSINPELDYVLNNLGYSYLKQGNYEAAVQALEKAVVLNNSDKRIRGNLGLAYARGGQHEKAFEEFKSVGNETTADYNISSVHSENSSGSKTKDHYLQSNTITPPVIQEEQPASVSAKSDDALIVDSQEENLKLFISRLTSQGTNREEIVYTSGRNDIKRDNLSQNEMVKRDSSPKVGIEISNGNGVNRMARRMGKYLNEKGFRVARLTNADNFNHAKTVISYQKDYLNEAQKVEQQIPGNQAMGKAVKHERPQVKIKVIIGKDIVKYNNAFSES